MRLVLRRRVLLPILLAAAVAAHAAPPSDESIDALFKVARIREVFERTRELAVEGLRQRVLSTSADADASDDDRQIHARAAELAAERVSALVGKVLDWNSIEPRVRQIYRETLSQDEVEGLAKFYATPLGQAMLDKVPGIVQRSTALASDLLAPIRPQIQGIVDQAMDDAKAGR